MSRRTFHQKAARVLEFQLACRDPEVAAARSLTRGVPSPGPSRCSREGGLADGHLLLNALSAGRVDEAPARFEPTPSRSDVVAWCNAWYSTAEVVLRLHMPVAQAEVFVDLPRPSVESALATARRFIARVKAQPAVVRSLLAERGLTSEVLAAGRSMIARAPKGRPRVDRRRDAAAMRELWLWYRDWSGTARAVIREPRLLRVLGFRAGSEDGVEESARDDAGEVSSGECVCRKLFFGAQTTSATELDKDGRQRKEPEPNKPGTMADENEPHGGSVQ